MGSYVQAVHVPDSSERLSLSVYIYTYVYTNAHMDSQKSENK